MVTRRAALSAVGLALASLSGCLQSDPNDDGPAAGDGDLGRSVLPEPSVSGEPEFVTITESNLAALRESQGKLTELDGDVGDLARSFVGDRAQFRLTDVDRITTQIASGAGTSGTAIAVVVVGDFDRDVVEGWYSEVVGGEYDSSASETGERGDFEWFAPGGDDEHGVLAVSDDVLVLRAGWSVPESHEEMATGAVDAASSDDRWFASDEQLVGALSDVEGHPNVAAVSGEADAAAESSESALIEDLAASALGTTPRSDEASLDLVAYFRGEAKADVGRDVVEQYIRRRVPSDPVLEALEFEAEGSVASASATVDGQALADSELEPVLRLPLYQYFRLSLGSSTDTPQVAWEFERRPDGRIEVTHNGGGSVQRPVTVRYEVDGERVEETWSEPDATSAGDSYVTERAGDTGTELSIVWTYEGESHVIGQYVFD